MTVSLAVHPETLLVQSPSIDQVKLIRLGMSINRQPIAQRLVNKLVALHCHCTRVSLQSQSNTCGLWLQQVVRANQPRHRDLIREQIYSTLKRP